MAARTDHIRLDAEQAARADIGKFLFPYKSRIYEKAKAHIATAIADAAPGAELNGTRIGEEATAIAIAEFLSESDVDPAAEAGGAFKSAA